MSAIDTAKGSASLAEKAVACTARSAASGEPKWRWLTRMRLAGCDATLVRADDGRPGAWFVADDLDGGGEIVEHDQTETDTPTLPDLDDAATLGCLIFELLPAAWGDPWFSIVPTADGTWRCTGSLDYRGLYGFSSRKAAAVYALEAAPC